MPGEGPALLGMLNIEVIDIFKIMCEVVGDPHKSIMFHLQTMQEAKGPSCRGNSVQQIKADANDTNSHTPG